MCLWARARVHVRFFLFLFLGGVGWCRENNRSPQVQKFYSMKTVSSTLIILHIHIVQNYDISYKSCIAYSPHTHYIVSAKCVLHFNLKVMQYVDRALYINTMFSFIHA